MIEDFSVKIEHWIKYENGTALDTKTGLLWMKKNFRNIEKTTPKNWDEAMAWADKINEEYFARFSNWRLPSIDEYQASLNSDRTKLAFDRKNVIRWVTRRASRMWEDMVFGPTSRRPRMEPGPFFIGRYSKSEDRKHNNPTMSVRLVRTSSRTR